MLGSPESGRALDRAAVQRAFEGIEAHLAERGLRAHIYIVGGAALMLAHRRSRSTMDVDALSIDHRDAVLAAARSVAQEQGLHDNWLNDEVRWIQVLTSQPDERAQVFFDSPHLVVTGASAAHVVAMKVRAARGRDLEDIKSLVRELEIITMDEVREIHHAVYPHDSIPWRSELRVEACLREVAEKRGHEGGSRRHSRHAGGHER